MSLTFDDVKKAIASDWLKLTLILVAVVGGWYKFDYRISAIEAKEQERTEQIERVSTVLDKLDRTLDKLQQAMRDFPLHRHINDEDVIYPGDTDIQNGKHR